MDADGWVSALRLKGRRAYQKLDTTLSASHPDAWTTSYITNEARETARFVRRDTLFGQEVLIFEDANGRTWANRVVNHSWSDDEAGAKSNKDHEQESTHDVDWVHAVK